jgi:GT2 family glycosyltransferase
LAWDAGTVGFHGIRGVARKEENEGMTAGCHETPGQGEQKRAYPRLAVVILNWNGWCDSLECLESIYRSCPPFEWQVVVVDNGSSNESVQKIQQWAGGRIAVTSKFFEYKPRSKPIPCMVLNRTVAEAGNEPLRKESLSFPVLEMSMPPLIVVTLPQNLGYAGGNNVGIRYALRHGFDYIGLLNNDTVVSSETLGGLVDYFNKDRAAGIVGVKTLYYDNPGKIWWAGSDLNLYRGLTPFRDTGCLDGPDFSGIRPTDVVSGHALFARREVFETAGLFDEGLFLIWEDTDLCLRAARQFSFRIDVNLDVCLWHKGQGISSSGSSSPAATYLANRNRLKVVWRHGTWGQRMAFLVFYVVSRVPKFSLLILKGKFTLVWAEWRAIGSFITSGRPRL